MKSIVAVILVSCTALLAGCAHPIDVTPNTVGLDASAGAISKPKIPAKAAYYISPELDKLEVTTPGGGGDNVRYFPYRAIESGFQKVMVNVFGSAIKLDSVPTPADLASKGINFLVVPSIVTTSGSTGFFTWPPTNFSVDLTSQVRSQDGVIISAPRVLGVGAAETGERLVDHGIAGRRAMADALAKMQAALLEISFNQQPTTQTPVTASVEKTLVTAPVVKTQSGSSSIEERLGRLKSLFSQGLLTEAEYKKKRTAIVDEL